MAQGSARRLADEAKVLPIHRRPVDLEHLAKQTLGDELLGHEVLRLFDQTARTIYGRLEASTTIEQLLMQLHTLKGAASGVGAWAIADLARLAESELKAGAPVSPERIDDIGLAVHEVSAFISELCGPDSP